MLVTILANADCPHCAHATDTLAEWCGERGVPVAGLDLRHHPEEAARWNVERSPTIVIESEGEPPRVFAGVPTHDEFDRLLRPG